MRIRLLIQSLQGLYWVKETNEGPQSNRVK